MFQKVAQPNKSGDRGKKCFAKGKSINQWQKSDPGAFSSQISDASIKSYPERRTVAIVCTLPVCIIYLIPRQQVLSERYSSTHLQTQCTLESCAAYWGLYQGGDQETTGLQSGGEGLWIAGGAFLSILPVRGKGFERASGVWQIDKCMGLMPQPEVQPWDSLGETWLVRGWWSPHLSEKGKSILLHRLAQRVWRALN